jgi:hypothetical protein
VKEAAAAFAAMHGLVVKRSGKVNVLDASFYQLKQWLENMVLCYPQKPQVFGME